MKEIKVTAELIASFEAEIEYYLDEVKGEDRIADDMYTLQQNGSMGAIVGYAEMYYRLAGRARELIYILDLLGLEVKGLEALRDKFGFK